MHAAPSVTYPVGRSGFAGGLSATLWCTGLLVAVLWTWQSASAGWRHWLAFAVVTAGGVLAARAWRRSATGFLRWDGEAWSWQPGDADAGAGRPEVALDLQSRLLLRWHAAAGADAWLWLERDRAAGAWEALRRAVYSPARNEAPHGAQPPVA
jgi:toxin CptA